MPRLWRPVLPRMTFEVMLSVAPWTSVAELVEFKKEDEREAAAEGKP